MRLKLLGKKNVYEEIAEQYKRYIELGVLKDGEKLPSCRALAMELGINPNTVERAYSELEAAGFIITLPKKGAYVRQTGENSDVKREAEKHLAALRTAGLTYEELKSIIARVYEEDSNS